MRYVRNHIGLQLISRRLFVIATAGLILSGCQAKEAPTQPVTTTQQTQEPKVQNAFTDYVDRGITTMNKAQSVADASNARARQTQQQAQHDQEQ